MARIDPQQRRRRPSKRRQRGGGGVGAKPIRLPRGARLRVRIRGRDIVVEPVAQMERAYRRGGKPAKAQSPHAAACN